MNIGDEILPSYEVIITHTIHGTKVGIYLPIHEWLIFMVNVGEFTIHGCLGVANYLLTGMILQVPDTRKPKKLKWMEMVISNPPVFHVHRDLDLSSKKRLSPSISGI